MKRLSQPGRVPLGGSSSLFSRVKIGFLFEMATGTGME